MHTTIKPWKCDECDYAHASKRGLVEHKKYNHPKESDIIFCHLCTYKTPDKSSLTKHIATIHNQGFMSTQLLQLLNLKAQI